MTERDEMNGITDALMRIALDSAAVDVKDASAPRLDLLPALKSIPLCPAEDVAIEGEDRRRVVCSVPDASLRVSFPPSALVKSSGPTATQRRECLSRFLRLADGDEEDVKAFVETFGVLDLPERFAVGERPDFAINTVRAARIQQPKVSLPARFWFTEDVRNYQQFARFLRALLLVVNDSSGGALTLKQRYVLWSTVVAFGGEWPTPEQWAAHVLSPIFFEIGKRKAAPKTVEDLLAHPDWCATVATFALSTITSLLEVRLQFRTTAQGIEARPALYLVDDWGRDWCARQWGWECAVTEGAPGTASSGSGTAAGPILKPLMTISPLYAFLAIRLSVAISAALKMPKACVVCGRPLSAGRTKLCGDEACLKESARRRQENRRVRQRAV